MRNPKARMGAIEEIYEELEADISLEEYREAVKDRVEKMGGLADEETAAKLVKHELEEEGGEVEGIHDIKAGMDDVKFVGKVVDIDDLRTFERDDEEDEGHVVNITVADETGEIRVAMWDEQAVDASESLETGEVLRIAGRPKDGFAGVEVNANKAEPAPEVEVDVQLDETEQIEDLILGSSNINVRGQVLDTEQVRTFQRDDDTEGKVANLTIGDPTGRCRVTLWDGQATTVEELTVGESIEIVDGYVRERDGDLEVHVGERGAIESVKEDIEYIPDTTPIEALDIGDQVDIAGVIRSTDPKRTFERDDGSSGQVKNVRIQDDTGDIRVALWGDLADRDLTPGEHIVITDVEIQEGWNDPIEASANWRSSMTVLDADSDIEQSPEETDGVDLTSFDEEQASSTTADTAEEEEVEFTGVVVQSGLPIILDNGEQTVSVEASTEVKLGDEVSVRGRRLDDGRIDAHELTKQ